MSHSPTPDKDLTQQFSKLIGILKNNPILINIIVALGTGSISWAFYSSDFQNQTYQEAKINLEEVCIHETTKEAFRKRYPNKNLEDYDLATPSHKLITDKPLVYPVFRWVCEFKTKGSIHGIDQQERLPVGLDLDKYCLQTYKDQSLKKATHRNYKDPNSLYCVNPN
ncbi:hypothetical protein [Dolichospermum circinale]|uniref:hypothetical protein n=1 Tax=Dolichospermum circinale TaxID=109265 RepID=UPI0004815D3C|nr:hypothetical protein [Dolichospermum circinale]MDB9454566.1 hypothetical protein [Dolichospermum circinale CS-541/06]MDB9461037.1 hypothetical protein [Dolichospermum circinale CS-541/04]MDB9476740.1 hypothetical protein [Dolichospermum circinale CS-537/11]MDB9480427.1 hypothetical protein [Dolichospermum circinale CS-537/03]MDB9492980.1 hypothetical protein [Dolichospermum circinale CS-534/05]